MKKRILVGCLSLALASFTVNEIANWSLDKAHSRLGFTINHMGINDIHGEFKTFEVKATTSTGSFEQAKIELTADVNSINTGISMRDDHLKTPDFFDAKKEPTLKFKSTSITKKDDKNYTVTGELEMRGIKKTVSFNALHNGTAKNQSGKDVAGFRMTGWVKRTDFKVGDASPGLAEEVMLNADIEIVQE